MGVICHATFFKPLVIKLQVCTSITASLLHFKSTVVGYRSKIIYTGSNSINTVDCIHQTSVCTKGYENMNSMWFIHWRSDSWVHQCKVLLSANSFFLFVWGAFCMQPWKKKKKKKHMRNLPNMLTSWHFCHKSRIGHGGTDSEGNHTHSVNTLWEDTQEYESTD